MMDCHYRVIHKCDLCDDDIKTTPSTKYRYNNKRICVYCATDMQMMLETDRNHIKT